MLALKGTSDRGRWRRFLELRTGVLLRQVPRAAREEPFQMTKKAGEFLWRRPQTVITRAKE
jgi:hypothetical protein